MAGKKLPPASATDIQKYLLERIEFDTNGGCWLWSGATLNGGYGSSSPRLGRRAHRLSYEAFVGRISDGLYVCHKCDVPRCVNPNHLFLGTQQDNMIDKAKKGRGNWPGLKGEKQKNSRLTENQVREIRNSFETQTALAKKFGVSQSTISLVITRQKWKHVE